MPRRAAGGERRADAGRAPPPCARARTPVAPPRFPHDRIRPAIRRHLHPRRRPLARQRLDGPHHQERRRRRLGRRNDQGRRVRARARRAVDHGPRQEEPEADGRERVPHAREDRDRGADAPRAAAARDAAQGSDGSGRGRPGCVGDARHRAGRIRAVRATQGIRSVWRAAGRSKVSAGFKLNKASAERWVASGFERPAA
ncbi:hypothetical protein CSX04_06083 [Burkholderia cepacia]|nr:hypothetical protein CSX04_06083 [Burkholderia cepacia]